jgi:hypothetical protein
LNIEAKIPLETDVKLSHTAENHKMQICVCGWYFREDFYRTLRQARKKYPVMIISNGRIGPWLGGGDKVRTLSFCIRKNIGLEWGAYDDFIKHHWDRKSPVLFLHDDIRVRPVMRNNRLLHPTEVFDSIAKLPFDQVYIFKSMQESIDNFRIHGRAFYCSARFLRYLLRYNDGFWFDENNTGHTQGPTPDHCLHFNEADYRFKHFLNRIPQKNKLTVGEYVILPALDCARRGRFEEEEAQQAPI